MTRRLFVPGKWLPARSYDRATNPLFELSPLYSTTLVDFPFQFFPKLYSDSSTYVNGQNVYLQCHSNRLSYETKTVQKIFL